MSQRRAIPQAVLDWMTRRHVDFLAESEDLPIYGSRVTDDAGRIHLGWIPTNVASHEELVRRTAKAIRILTKHCRAHDVANVWIVDTSMFPSSAAVNPALTLAANVLRVAASGELTAWRPHHSRHQVSCRSVLARETRGSAREHLG